MEQEMMMIMGNWNDSNWWKLFVLFHSKGGTVDLFIITANAFNKSISLYEIEIAIPMK